MITSAALLMLALSAPLTERDLAPLLSGRAAGAPAALAAGNPDEALRLLAGERGPAARLLRARALSRAGRDAEALQLLQGLEASFPEIADRIHFLRGRLLSAGGRHAAAALSFEQVAPTSILSEAAAVLRGRALAASGREQEAIGVLAPIGERPAPADLSQEDHAAAALSATGTLLAGRDPAAARKAFVACWVDHPIAPESQGCLAALRRLPGDAGKGPTDEQEVLRAERLLEANRNRTAIAALERVVEHVGDAGPQAELACRARSALGRAYRRERRHAMAIELLRPVVSGCADAGLRVRALFVLAGSIAIARDKEEAQGLYRKLATENPGSSLADDALVSAADLLERLGRPEEALEVFAAAAKAGAGGDKRPEALFRQAWAARRSGDLHGAAERFQAIEEEFKDRDPYEHARAAYWRARSLATSGPDGKGTAKALWEELVRRYPVDWYGLLSRARLAEARGEGNDALPVPLAIPAEAAPAFEAGALGASQRFQAALCLLRLGLGEEAADELRAIELAPLRAGTGGTDALFLVAALLDRAGDHRSAHALLKEEARGILRAAPAGDAIRLWRIAYPAAFRPEVTRWATAARVPPDLLQALMREESALDPAVVSPAGAIGLTQLMPSTAAAVARRLGMGPILPGSLTNPVTNIRIGAAYLGELLARYGRQPALALAAYNAGGGAVGRWLDARGALELDEFVEEIPIDETRGYVKRVLRTFAAYRLLSGEAHPEPLDLLPRTLRRDAHSEAISPAGSAPGTAFGLLRRSD
ncbi:MAG: transglycosylase SLT domain-containing protein [Anaeromyxobacteraceae bacterium]